MELQKYNVIIDYWNGGNREIVTGEPVELEEAKAIQRALHMGSISGEFFVNIEEVL